MDEILDIGKDDKASYNLGLTPLHPPQKSVIRTVLGINLLVLLIGIGFADVMLAKEAELTPLGIFLGPAAILALIIFIMLPERKYRRWGYDMAADQLRVLRGYLFRTDTVVPFNRIQHIDVAQGPIQRFYGVSTLIVHTAGTHNSVVDLPGLKPEDAEAMREEMRKHIKQEMI